MYGGENKRTAKPYKEQIEEADELLKNALTNLCADENLREKIDNEIYTYISNIQSLYGEIGFQAGIILSSQIWNNLLPCVDK